jgi:two-component sensor histidine kinase
LLAVNELVLNALRHAFPDGRVGSVAVQLTSRNGEVRVVVADNGVGLRAGHPDEGFGMKLVEMMTRKINGALYINSGAGTRVTIVVAEPQPVPDAGTNSPAPLGIAIA